MSKHSSTERRPGAVDPEVETFCRVSRVLTGVTEINTHLAAIYLARVKADQEAVVQLPAFMTAANAFVNAPAEQQEQEARALLIGSPELATLTQRIITLWYTGQLPSPDLKRLTEPTTPEEFFGAVMWNVMGAHPPGLSGGYFGYWRYPPEN